MNIFSLLYGETRDQRRHKNKEQKIEAFEISPNIPKQSKEYKRKFSDDIKASRFLHLGFT